MLPRRQLILIALAALAALLAYLYSRRRSSSTRSIRSREDTSRPKSPSRVSISSDDDGALRSKSSTSSASRRSGGSSSSSKKHRGSSRGDEQSGEPKPVAGLPDFIMLMGIPGSGKSTWAKEYVFKCDPSFVVVSSDEVRKQLTGTINDQSRNDEVWEIVLNQVVSQLKSGRNVILDATNTRTDFRRQFVRQLPPCNRYLKVFTVNKSIAKARVAKDLVGGVERATVPEAVMDKMYASFLDSQTAIKDERWIVK